MNDEWTRENRIKKLTLRIQLLTPYMMAMSIFIALAVFIFGSSIYGIIEKDFLILVLIGGMIILGYNFYKHNSEIEDIFKN